MEPIGSKLQFCIKNPYFLRLCEKRVIFERRFKKNKRSLRQLSLFRLFLLPNPTNQKGSILVANLSLNCSIFFHLAYQKNIAEQR